MSDDIKVDSDSKEHAAPKNRSNKHSSSAREREYVKEFIDANTHIAVRIQKTAAFRPYYSMTVGRYVEHENGQSFVPYLSVRCGIEHSKVTSVQDNTKVIAGLVADATEWIRERVQEREDEIAAQQDRMTPSKMGIRQRVDRVTKTYA